MDTFEAEIVGGPRCGEAVTVDAEQVNGNGRVMLADKSGRINAYQIISHPGTERSWVGLHYIESKKKMSR